jgi:hypothetical protein
MRFGVFFTQIPERCRREPIDRCLPLDVEWFAKCEQPGSHRYRKCGRHRAGGRLRGSCIELAGLSLSIQNHSIDLAKELRLR